MFRCPRVVEEGCVRILVGMIEIASLVYNFADGFRALGHEVTSVVLYRNHFYPHHNYDIVTNGEFTPQSLDHLIEQHDLFVFVWAERSLTPDKSEYQRIRESGKKIVSIFCGSDVRHASAYRQLYGVPINEIWEGEADDALAKRLHNVRHEELYSDLIISLPNNTPLSVRPYMQMYLPIILERYECVIPERNIPVVVHAPSNKSVKGTAVIAQALERLKADGIAFEFRLLHGVSNQEIQPELRNADVVVDQLYLPHTGMLGLEAMASGCAVASWNREELDPLPAHRPVWFIDADNIYVQLKRLLTDKELRVRLAREARVFVEQHHDHLKMAQRVIRYLTEGITEYDHYPSFFLREYALAAGNPIPKYLLDATTHIIKKWGVPADLDVRKACAGGLLSTEGLERIQEIPRWLVTTKTRTRQQRSEDIKARMNSAQDACSRGDTFAARDIISACIAAYPYFPEAYLALALIDIVHGELKSSRRNLNQLELLEPEHPELPDALRLLQSKERLYCREYSKESEEQNANSPVVTKNQIKEKNTAGFSCIFINTYYPSFLSNLYERMPELAEQPYATQKQLLQRECFGDSDFYSQGMIHSGWKAGDLIANCPPLQHAWALENGFAGQGTEIVIEQIRRTRPEVVYLQDSSMATADFIAAIRPFTELVVLQHASPIPPQADFGVVDIIFTAAPHFVEMFRKLGVACYYIPLAFEPRVCAVSPPFSARAVDVSFVGGFSGMHLESFRLMEHLAVTTPIQIWGYGTETLSHNSPVRLRHRGEAWGLGMFKILANSKITINRHGEIAENYACNMRLFEATGCGALLITEYKDNLNDLFEIGKEVVAYRSPEECAALVNYYLVHTDEAEAIARAGQARTLRDHTYSKRMKRTAGILERHLRYRRERTQYTVPDMSAISHGHRQVQQNEITPAMANAWRDEAIPARQRGLVQQSLAAMYRGEDMGAYRILAEMIKPHLLPGYNSVLELGCSSGYVYEILDYYLNKQLDYTGADYSDAMINMARDYYPGLKFFVADGANLCFADRQFHIVISSCVLLHVPNYRDHIFETARVADRFIVASRTPICKRRPTQYLSKLAYGVETVELVFNQNELLELFALNQFQLVHAVEYQAEPSADIYQITYLLKRMS